MGEDREPSVAECGRTESETWCRRPGGHDGCHWPTGVSLEFEALLYRFMGDNNKALRRLAQ